MTTQISSVWIFVLGIAILLLPHAAHAGQVQIYINGCPTTFEVPDDLEMYELEPVLILEDNRELLKEYCLQCPQEAVIGIGNQAWDRDLADPDYFGERGIQPYIRDIRYRDYLSSEEWNSAWGDLSYPGRMRLDLDHSGPGWSLDGTFMNFESVGSGPDGLSEEELVVSGHKERSQFDMKLRSGGMNGGTQFLTAQWYKVSADEMPYQVVDVEHLRIGTGFRMVECPGMLQAEVFSGYYKSDRQAMDNTYSGVSADGSLYLGERAALDASSSTTSFDAKLQNGNAQRSDADAALSYRLNDDLLLSAGVSAYSDTSDISAVSDARQYSERALRMDYHPSSRTDMSLSLSRREVNYQRMGWELEDVYDLNLRDPEIDRADLAEFRVAEQADYDSLRFRSNFRLDSCSRLSADFRLDDYGSLPDTGDATALALRPSYLANDRQWSSFFYERYMTNGGRLEMVASESRRSNDIRDSQYCSRRYALSYGDALNSCSSWRASLGRTETDLSGAGIDVVWDSATTIYGLDFSGHGAWAQYRLSLGHHVRDGASSGDYSSLGLELDLNDSPLVLNTWWREQEAGRQPLAFSGDVGLSLGWRIQF